VSDEIGRIVPAQGPVTESWSQVVALILRDMEPEMRLEFMRVLGVWKRNSTDAIRRNSDLTKTCYEGDLMRAESRMVKLQALEEHLQRELDFSADMMASMRRMLR
jgi:hypothetical protein